MSRYAASEDSYSRYAPSSPASYDGEELQSADPSVKLMRLKVLYTTDDKTNCMARWPKALPVRTAFLDEKTEIGVVELRTCIKAIVTSSPELVAKLGHDYTVYAYDYSEFETPLVGQGMLSWVLASSSSTANASAGQGATMVTGRVSKNANALFGRDNIAQTLEVKLRLVPVPTILQSDFIESLKKYKDISRVMPDTFDPQGWTDFLKANPQVLSTAGISGSVSPQKQSNGLTGLENVQRLMHQRPSYGQHPQSTHSRRESFAESIVSREASPTPSTQSAFAEPRQLLPQPSVRGDLRRTASTGQLPGSDFDAGEELDEGPARKRARVTQVKRPGKNAGFRKQPDSLLVTASTANGVRILQPNPLRPGLDRGNSLEEPPRAPTPVPKIATRAPRRSKQPARSSLGRAATFSTSTEAAASFRGAATMSFSAAGSPEANSVLESSPGEDPGSSPPVPVSRAVTLAPSSPQLPPTPLHEDSGFMSGNLDDEIETDVKVVPPVSDIGSTISQPGCNRKGTAGERTKLKRLATKTPCPDPLTAQEAEREKSRRNALRAIGWRRVQSFSDGQASRSSTAAPASNSTGSVKESVAKEAASKEVAAAEPNPKSKHAYDKEKQKQRMQQRLMNAIAAGEKPPLCENCGAVNSLTWRKAYKRQHSGTPENVKTGRGPGAILAVLIEESNEQGEITLFSIIKKTLAPGDEGFNHMLLCNPCGLWLASKYEMRPPRVWANVKTSQVTIGEVFSTDADLPQQQQQQPFDGRLSSAAPLPSEMSEPRSEAPMPAFPPRLADSGQETETNLFEAGRDRTAPQEADDEPELPTLPEARKANHEAATKSRPDSAMSPGSVAALQRAIRSSPRHNQGSRHSPIEVDTTPDRTRRVLFPSPRGSTLSAVSGNKRGSLSDSPDAPKQVKYSNGAPEITVEKISGKENLMPPPPTRRNRSESEERAMSPTPPQEHENEYFADAFKSPVAPSTPSRSHSITLPFPKSPSNTFNTPSKMTPGRVGAAFDNCFSSAEKAFLHGQPATPTRTPSRSMAKNTPGSRATDTPFTRQMKNIFSCDPSTYEFDTSPSKVFGDLPMMGGDDFSEWAMTTDIPMPSSPPISRSVAFGGLKTPGGKEGVDKQGDSPEWDELGLGKTPRMSL